MRPMKMKEKIHNKVISMVQIALDDVIQPNTEYQKGERKVSSGYFDEFGNRFDLYLKLKVCPFDEYEEDELDSESENILDDLIAQVEALKARRYNDTIYDDTELLIRLQKLEIHQNDDIADILDILHMLNPNMLIFKVSSEIGARIGNVTLSYNGEEIETITNLYGFIMCDINTLDNVEDGIFTLSKNGFVSQNWVFSTEQSGNIIPLNMFCDVTMKQL